MDESLRRLDWERICAAGYACTSESAAMAAGPVASFEAHVPLAGAWWLTAGLGWASLFVPTGEITGHRWEAGLNLGVRATF